MPFKECREAIVLENQGQKIFGVLHRPLFIDQYPAVLICHGLAGNKVGSYRLYVHIAKLLAEQGIAVLRIDFRGSGDSEGDFAEMTLESEVSDACLASSFLSNDAHIDKTRIGILGRSLGGAVAVLTASQFSTIKTLCLWAPLYSGYQWQPLWEHLHTAHLQPEEKQALMTIDGQLPGYAFYQQLFDLQMETILPSIATRSLCLIHGSKDQTVQLAHTEKYVKARLEAKAETKFIQLPLSDHDFSPLAERLYVLEETVSWFTQRL